MACENGWKHSRIVSIIYFFGGRHMSPLRLRARPTPILSGMPHTYIYIFFKPLRAVVSTLIRTTAIRKASAGFQHSYTRAQNAKFDVRITSPANQPSNDQTTDHPSNEAFTGQPTDQAVTPVQPPTNQPTHLTNGTGRPHP